MSLDLGLIAQNYHLKKYLMPLSFHSIITVAMSFFFLVSIISYFQFDLRRIAFLFAVFLYILRHVLPSFHAWVIRFPISAFLVFCLFFCFIYLFLCLPSHCLSIFFLLPTFHFCIFRLFVITIFVFLSFYGSVLADFPLFRVWNH